MHCMHHHMDIGLLHRHLTLDAFDVTLAILQPIRCLYSAARDPEAVSRTTLFLRYHHCLQLHSLPVGRLWSICNLLVCKESIQSVREREIQTHGYDAGTSVGIHSGDQLSLLVPCRGTWHDGLAR